MALTRARPVAGDETLFAEIEQEVSEFWPLPRDTAKIAKDVAEMRA